jgi:hypothetical protein
MTDSAVVHMSKHIYARNAWKSRIRLWQRCLQGPSPENPNIALNILVIYYFLIILYFKVFY